MQRLVELFKTRNRLVHPRPKGGLSAWIHDLEPDDERVIGPAAAGGALLAVADTVVICNPLREHPILHGGIAKTIVRNRLLVERHQARAGMTIADVPDKSDAGVLDLFGQMQARIKRTGESPASNESPSEGEPPSDAAISSRDEPAQPRDV